MARGGRGKTGGYYCNIKVSLTRVGSLIFVNPCGRLLFVTWCWVGFQVGKLLLIILLNQSLLRRIACCQKQEIFWTGHKLENSYGNKSLCRESNNFFSRKILVAPLCQPYSLQVKDTAREVAVVAWAAAGENVQPHSTLAGLAGPQGGCRHRSRQGSETGLGPAWGEGSLSWDGGRQGWAQVHQW